MLSALRFLFLMLVAFHRRGLLAQGRVTPEQSTARDGRPNRGLHPLECLCQVPHWQAPG